MLRQASAAPKADQMLGSELHKMFVERAEITQTNEFEMTWCARAGRHYL
jgi:hypothetical protein